MKQVIAHIIEFWKFFFQQISWPYLAFSVALSLCVFFGARYMARWSRAINDSIVDTYYSTDSGYDLRYKIADCPPDVSAIVNPYYWQYAGIYQPTRVDDIIERYNLSLDNVQFRNTYSLLGWLKQSGRENEELLVLSRETPTYDESCYSFITDYVKNTYEPLIYDLVERGDYYAAKNCLDRLFKIYSLAGDFPAFSGELNKMYLLYAILQDRWEASVNREFTKDALDQILDDNRFKGHLEADKNVSAPLSFVGFYFDGLDSIKQKNYDDAHSCFIQSFEHSTSQFTKELTSLMIVRCAVWKYDISKEPRDYKNALSDIRQYSKIVSLPYLKSDMDGYNERLHRLYNENTM